MEQDILGCIKRIVNMIESHCQPWIVVYTLMLYLENTRLSLDAEILASRLYEGHNGKEEVADFVSLVEEFCDSKCYICGKLFITEDEWEERHFPHKEDCTRDNCQCDLLAHAKCCKGCDYV